MHQQTNDHQIERKTNLDKYTNITSEVIAAGIYTKEQVELFAKRDLRSSTYIRKWKTLGCRVIKGQKAIIETRLWKFSSKVVTLKDTDVNETKDSTITIT